MTGKPWPSAYALYRLFGSAGQELRRSLPLKEEPAKQLPYTWRLGLTGAALRLYREVSTRSESFLGMVLTGSTKDSEVSDEMRDNDQKFV